MIELSPSPVASSVHRPWSGMVAQLYHWEAGGSVVSPVLDHDIIAMRVTGSVRLTQHRAGEVHRTHATPGNVTLHARGFESRWSWDRPGAILVVRATQDLLAAASEAFAKRAGPVELQNCFGARDAFIEPIMNLLALELRRPPHPAQELISGGLSAALLAHLIQRFSTRPTSGAPARGRAGGLANWQVHRVTSYMLDHLDRSVTLDELARLVDLSGAHFCTAFRLAVGLTPGEWAIQKRIERARELLADSTLSITEIALTLGYTPSSFGAIFRQRVGVTPSAFRRAM